MKQFSGSNLLFCALNGNKYSLGLTLHDDIDGFISEAEIRKNKLHRWLFVEAYEVWFDFLKNLAQKERWNDVFTGLGWDIIDPRNTRPTDYRTWLLAIRAARNSIVHDRGLVKCEDDIFARVLKGINKSFPNPADKQELTDAQRDIVKSFWGHRNSKLEIWLLDVEVNKSVEKETVIRRPYDDSLGVLISHAVYVCEKFGGRDFVKKTVGPSDISK